MDLQKFYMGECFDAYEFFGAHTTPGGGVIFRTYAPNAHRICVVGQFNQWQEQPLLQEARSGVWTRFEPKAVPGQMYKYVIYGENGRAEHCDPYGFQMELRPGCCSIICDLKEYQFSDQDWMAQRSLCRQRPINIYELHLGSWKRREGDWYDYSSIASELIPYLKKQGYNYVEFLPLAEHPFDGSWGYQNTGFFAPTSRYGTPQQLMHLIDQLHQAGIGAVMDFVPVHFAVDGYGLRQYDGTWLFEYPHKDVGESEWGSLNFIHSRRETACFLQSAANYWLKEYHFDGLRMDAVSRLIYWQGDERRGENSSAIHFLKTMNSGLRKLHPSALLMAEDSTAFPGVTKEVEQGGLGFDYKWDLGWMNDTLSYLSAHPEDRIHMSQKITFSILYAYQERYILPFSHDENVHGKKTVIDKLWGSYEENFSQARLLYLYMMTHPGKKLNFMGNELAMFREWDEARELDWELLRYPSHDSFCSFIRTLNECYLSSPALWEIDHSYDGFKWVDCRCDSPCVFAYTRTGESESLLTVLNFSNREVSLAPLLSGTTRLLLNSDWEPFGGKTPRSVSDRFQKTVPPFTGLLYAYAPQDFLTTSEGKQQRFG